MGDIRESTVISAYICNDASITNTLTVTEPNKSGSDGAPTEEWKQWNNADGIRVETIIQFDSAVSESVSRHFLTSSVINCATILSHSMYNGAIQPLFYNSDPYNHINRFAVYPSGPSPVNLTWSILYNTTPIDNGTESYILSSSFYGKSLAYHFSGGSVYTQSNFATYSVTSNNWVYFRVDYVTASSVPSFVSVVTEYTRYM
jgi:hypothetical protein